ncbi:MAG: hypothetical protein KAR79_06370, partial [Simkaniaceae bacterium]|nr:hypothetical protein [Simkaniaceae bacterium]
MVLISKDWIYLMTVTNVLPSFIPDTLQTLHDEISHSMYNHLPDNVCTVLSHEWFTHFATAIIASVGIILAATTTISFPAIFLSGLFLSGSALIVHTMLLSDANYMQRTGVNPVHMQKTLEIEEQITTFPEGIDENSI